MDRLLPPLSFRRTHHLHTHMHTHTCTRVHTHPRTHNVARAPHTHTLAQTHTLGKHTHASTHSQTCMHTHTHTHMHRHTHVRTHRHIHEGNDTHTLVHTQANTHTHAPMYTHACNDTTDPHTHIHRHTNTHTHLSLLSWPPSSGLNNFECGRSVGEQSDYWFTRQNVFPYICSRLNPGEHFAFLLRGAVKHLRAATRGPVQTIQQPGRGTINHCAWPRLLLDCARIAKA